MRFSIPATVCLPVFLSACCFLSGCLGRQAGIAGTLLELRDSETRKNAVMAQETRNFERAKRILLETKKNGEVLTRDSCRRLFGEPSSELSGGKSWGYKPETSDWFKGEKIFLYFDDKGSLARWEYSPS